MNTEQNVKNQNIQLINRVRLLEKINYSNKWNNVPCPQWVLGIIKSMPIQKMQD